MLQITIEPELQQEVDTIFQKIGVSADTVVSHLYEYVREEQRLPEVLHIPNALTRATFESTDRGEDLIEYATTEELFQSLEELRVPNKLTRETIERSEAGIDVTRCSSLEDLYQKLGI